MTTSHLRESVAERVRNLPAAERREFELRCARLTRSDDTVATLVWCIGAVGGHRFYLGHSAMALFFLVTATVGWGLVVTGGSASLGGGLLVLVNVIALLVDIVRHEKLTKKANLLIRRQVLNEIGMPDDYVVAAGLPPRK